MQPQRADGEGAHPADSDDSERHPHQDAIPISDQHQQGEIGGRLGRGELVERHRRESEREEHEEAFVATRRWGKVAINFLCMCVCASLHCIDKRARGALFVLLLREHGKCRPKKSLESSLWTIPP